MTDDPRLDRVKEAWEAAYLAFPGGGVEPSLIIVPRDDDDEWTVFAYVEHDPEGGDLLRAADHLMMHLVSEPVPPWLGHASIAFSKVVHLNDLDSLGSRGALQAAAEAGDDSVREVLTVTVQDMAGPTTQHYSRPLNEPIGDPMRGTHSGLVTSVLGAMLKALTS